MRLLRELDSSALTDGSWSYHEMATREEEEDILACFTDDFLRMFPSFSRADPNQWISSRQKVILENSVFYICLEDNMWSLAVELIQKEGPLGQNYEAIQARSYLRYLDGIRKCLLDRLPSIGTYDGPWTSGRIKKNDLSA